jgi:hypothetical protein
VRAAFQWILPKKSSRVAAALFAALLIVPTWAMPANAGETPPFTCTVNHWHDEWVDYPIVWKCECAEDGHGHFICMWQPYGVTVVDQRMVYYGSQGHTWIFIAFDSNPDAAGTMTHSRTVSGAAKTQATGELRSRTAFHKWNGSAWVNCSDSGFTYSTGSYSEWVQQRDMGSTADCGAGTYRVVGWGYMYDSGWLGDARITPTCYRD